MLSFSIHKFQGCKCQTPTMIYQGFLVPFCIFICDTSMFVKRFI